MAISRDSRSAAVRSRLDHPVIDGDGHWLEPIPIFLDYLRQVAGPAITERYVRLAKGSPWYDMTSRERMDKRMQRDTWWGEPGNTLDRATAMIPRLFHERLDDFGVDFAMVYTTLGLLHISHPDEEMRRALNVMSSEMFGKFSPVSGGIRRRGAQRHESLDGIRGARGEDCKRRRPISVVDLRRR